MNSSTDSLWLHISKNVIFGQISFPILYATLGRVLPPAYCVTAQIVRRLWRRRLLLASCDRTAHEFHRSSSERCSGPSPYPRQPGEERLGSCEGLPVLPCYLLCREWHLYYIPRLRTIAVNTISSTRFNFNRSNIPIRAAVNECHPLMAKLIAGATTQG